MGHYEFKQIVIIRRDLKMRRGKEIAQGSHGSMAAYFEAEKMAKHIYGQQHTIKMTKMRKIVDAWLAGGFAKICLQIDNEADLLEIYRKAQEAGIPAALITDSGKTEFNGVPTNTCLGLGPYDASEIDKITGSLKLY